MDCPDCGEETVAFAVPEEYRELAPGDDEVLALCPTCLGLHPTADADPEPDFARVGDAFPTGAAAIPMALVLGSLDSLALHRSAIETLLERVERAGADPLLVLDRLAADPGVDARVDLDGRRRQVSQFRA
ncbi:DUF6276 family protein [Halococcus hamelinensis]|uniref:Small CPxCG-related zinc finger protein n=1 Tax=Halococcus hamelinensis 100A6 TaxID=1132509 RepID=M0LW12_9EURY|nr:DUF6276 family protein [Halococcus hamelinensis]EMA36519.1 hypothetical protein C447_14716 [Halococcus hamelinensis 100A6]